MTQLSSKLPWEQANTKWAAALNPLLANPIFMGVHIQDIVLAATTPKAINHLLQRMPQGWFVTDNTAISYIWRTKPFNDLTITLEASASTTISIWIF